MQNEDQIQYIRFYTHRCLQTLSDKLGGEKNFINNVIMTVTQPGYNLQPDAKWGPDSVFEASKFFNFRITKCLTYAEDKFRLNTQGKLMF